MSRADAVVSTGGSFDVRRGLDTHCVEYSKPALFLAASGPQGKVEVDYSVVFVLVHIQCRGSSSFCFFLAKSIPILTCSEC